MKCQHCDNPATLKSMCNKCYQRSYYQANRERVVTRIRNQRTHKRNTDPVWREHDKAQNRKWKRAPHGRYLNSKRCAKDKKLSFTLSEEQYLSIIANDCYYCQGFFPKVECNLGLDRIDNDRGYELDNVLSCCTTCNNTRNAHFTVAETKAMIQLVIAIRKSQLAT